MYPKSIAFENDLKDSHHKSITTPTQSRSCFRSPMPKKSTSTSVALPTSEMTTAASTTVTAAAAPAAAAAAEKTTGKRTASGEKASKKSSEKVAAPAAAAAPVAAAPVAADKTDAAAPAAKKSRKAATPAAEKTADAAAAAPVAAAAPSVTEAVDGAAAATAVSDANGDEENLLRQSADFLSEFQTVYATMSKLKNQYKELEKKWNRELKAAKKRCVKKRGVPKNPSGFTKPAPISDELATFLGKEKGTEMSRTQVTGLINHYVRANGLKNPENGRNILPDAKLSTLLAVKDGELLTFFNLQRFLKHHFAKAPAATEAAAATASAK